MMSTLPMINIDQQYATIGINVTPAQMKITTPHPEMTVTSESPEMTVESKRPEFKVNWKKVRSESGLKPPGDFTLSVRDNARGKIMNYVGESVHDGDYLGKVEAPGNRVARQSRTKSLKTAQVDINIESVPKSLPEVEWKPGYIHIKWSDHKFKIDWQGEYMPEILIDPPFSVEIFLRDRPYIKISVEDQLERSYAGRVVDKML